MLGTTLDVSNEAATVAYIPGGRRAFVTKSKTDRLGAFAVAI